MFSMKKVFSVLSATLFSAMLLLSPFGELYSQEILENADPAVIIAYSGDVFVTQKELDAAFAKIPSKDRLAFIRDGAKVDGVIRSLLKLKAVANDARKAGYDQRPLIPEMIYIAGEKELAEDWIQEVMRNAPVPDFEVIAHEDYIANPDNYRTEELLDISHILIATEQLSQIEAEQLANLLISRLEKDPDIFKELVIEYSDDPAKVANGGRYPEMRRGQMVAPFEQAAFALTEPGQIGGPVKTEYGYHIIRLNDRAGNELPEFGEIEEQATELVRQKYYEDYQKAYLRKLLSQPIVIPEGAVEIMAKRHFGENLELAPDYNELNN